MRLGREFTKTDAKGRFVVPQRMREALGSRVTMTTGLMGELLCFRDEHFDSYVQDLQARCINEDDRRLLQMTVIDPAESGLEFDSSGRLSIHQSFRKELGWAQSTEIVLVWSSDDYLQIWEQSEYAEMRKNPAGYRSKQRAVLQRIPNRFQEPRPSRDGE